MNILARPDWREEAQNSDEWRLLVSEAKILFGSLSKGLVWAVLLLNSVSADSACTEPTRHIVFIMVDDMGWNDVSFHGSDQIQTPNIDALAYQGVILQQYYSEAICTPARTALLTGKYPMRTGMQGLPLRNLEDRGIPLTERLLPSYLKDLGYATHLVGKWHVGMSREQFLPTARGYDSHYGLRGAGADYYTYNHNEEFNGNFSYGLDLFDNDIPQEEEDRYIVDALTGRAVDIIQGHNVSQPLFLHVTHNAPHAGNDGANLQPPLYSSVGNRHIANSDRRLYANVVNHLDRSVGEIVKALADRNILDKTVIVFISDNGAPTLGNHQTWGVNIPFRGMKSTPWEGGVRVPAFVWHANLKPNVWNGLMHITDWLPTLIAAVGGKYHGNHIDGVNQWESISQAKASERKEVLITSQVSQSNVYAAYRSRNYKILVGNLSGLSNDYYGEDFVINKYSPPDYFTALQSCAAAKALANLGKFMENEVEAKRDATIVRQLDDKRDAYLCLPTPNKGCLYDLQRDPREQHDIWDQSPNASATLFSELQGLLAQQQQPLSDYVDPAGDPANHGFVWLTWINESK